MSGREEPPPAAGEREAQWAGDHTSQTRDVAPAVGTHGGPGAWERGQPEAAVALQRAGWADAAWSFLYARDTRYGADTRTSRPSPTPTGGCAAASWAPSTGR